jgi:anthranilate synthase
VEPLIYNTQSGIEITRSERELPIENIHKKIREDLKTQVGALFASGYEYPGRYNRWDIAFSNPPIELISKGRQFEINARNEKGKQMLKGFIPFIENHLCLEKSIVHENQFVGHLKKMDDFFPEELRSRQPSLFSILRTFNEQLGGSKDEYLGFYGAFGYDLVFQFDPIDFKHKRENTEDAKLYIPDNIIIVDRRLEKAYELHYDFKIDGQSTQNSSRESEETSTLHKASGVETRDHSPGAYAHKVQKIQDGCKKGDFFEVVLSQKFSIPYSGDALDVLDIIQTKNPSPYEFILQLGEEQLVGASPEMFVRVEGKRVETCPISGTVARGESPLEDADQIRALLSSDKEEAELTMCTDVDRNDKSRVCKPESVNVLGRRLIEMYSRVIHTVDHVEGELKDDMDGLDAFLSHMWAVTLSGSPKKAAMQAIEDLEESARGWYGGAVGILGFNGNINTGITIRTVHLKNGRANIRVGATLLAESNPESEEKETELKASAFISAVRGTDKKLTKPALNIHSGNSKKVLFVDHQDSFVHTLAGYVRRTGAEVLTLRSGFPMEYLEDFNPDLVFLSPGPFTPAHFKLPEFINHLMEKKLPLFGVCLGMQGMIESQGGKLGVLDIPKHGVPALIQHNGTGVFKDLPNPMKASRYHSLFGLRDNLPDCFEVTAKSEDDVIMAVQHKSYPMAGVQFHPESIHALRADAGLRLIDNALSEFL